MSSDVFLLSSACEPTPAEAIRQAMQLAGLSAPRVADAVFGLDDSPSPDLNPILSSAGLACPSVAVTTSMRALFFAAGSILGDDVASALVIGLHPGSSAAVLLASPELVGLLNLPPRARLAARSLSGPIPLQGIPTADGDGPETPTLSLADIEITKTGDRAALLLHELLQQLESQSARWGLLTVAQSSLLIERT